MHAHDHDSTEPHDQGGAARVVAQGRDGTASHGIDRAAMPRLQRLTGNRAVAGVVQRFQPTPAGGVAPPTAPVPPGAAVSPAEAAPVELPQAGPARITFSSAPRTWQLATPDLTALKIGKGSLSTGPVAAGKWLSVAAEVGADAPLRVAKRNSSPGSPCCLCWTAPCSARATIRTSPARTRASKRWSSCPRPSTCSTSAAASVPSACGGTLPTRKDRPDSGGKGPANPTGLTPEDPIPMTWFKPLDMYAKAVTIPKDCKGNTITIRMFPHREVDGLDIGVDQYWPYVGRKIRKTQRPRGGGEKKFARELEAHGCEVVFPTVGKRRQFDFTDIDHVLDLFWDGPDDETNLWPLERATNQLAGSRNLTQEVVWALRKGGQARPTPLGAVPRNRWFVIRDFQDPR
ncbi:hypothetical protein ACQEVF_01575 [Nonomuraea polychroma]|uniref:hypothetical protein n=1 Tax=Nonomuraea polychroma TaxID=46176 RepID=UPI003D8D37DE